ncbi:Calcyphosphine isoform 2, partial [Operophtera brumata]
MDSGVAWHRPQSASSRVDDELMQKSARALTSTTDPLQKLRLMCLSRGASGILGLSRRVPARSLPPRTRCRSCASCACRAAPPAFWDLAGQSYDDELMQKSARALSSTTDPLQKLRLLIFRRMDDDQSKQLNKEEFLNGIKETGLDLSMEDAEELFLSFDTDNSGSISLDEFLVHIRPPMSESRCAIVEQAFRKLDKTGDGHITIDDIK